MNRVTIRRATPADEQTVANLWVRASELLRQRGTDQWQYPVRMDNIRNAINNGNCWIIENPDGVRIGTVTLDDFADPELWRADDHPDRAYYVHRLVLTEDARGGELGSAVLDWASSRAKHHGKQWLRLDAWSSNPGLHEYYLDRGFRLFRRVPDVVSGVLFERDAGVTLGHGPHVDELPDV